MPRMTRSEVGAAIAAIAQGQLSQARLVVEDIYDRLEAIEGAGQEPATGASASLQDVQDAEPPEHDAKSVDVRESLRELTERFNRLLAVLKGTKEEANG